MPTTANSRGPLWVILKTGLQLNKNKLIMKVKFLILGLGLLTMTACVPKSDYEKLEKEKTDVENHYEKLEKEKTDLENQLEEIKQELSSMSDKYYELYDEKRKAEIERNKTPHISKSEALQYIKDNYSFYEKDMLYRNVQLRRISDNSFRVSLEECSNKGPFSDNEFFWNSNVRTLTVHSNGKYDF